MTKPGELRLLGDTDRAQRLDEARKELFNLRFQLATGRLDNVSRIAVVRKEIARLITLAHEETAPPRPPKRPRRRRG
jgi:large subunit ribosomal protein L29